MSYWIYFTLIPSLDFNIGQRANQVNLALHIIKEIFQYWGKWNIILSRPCVYGVFSGPIGGFAPRPKKCVGCLRCMVENPHIVQISHNQLRRTFGDSYFNSDYYNTVLHEAETGRVPIKGAGYRGRFGGEGWDGIWTDMSEIVRPTRDGIHGREYISTDVDIGEKPVKVDLSSHHEFKRIISLPIPYLFDAPPSSLASLIPAFEQAAEEIQTYSMTPIALWTRAKHSIPIVGAEEIPLLHGTLPLIALRRWDKEGWHKLRALFPESIIIVKGDFDTDLIKLYQEGVRVFHLSANYHGINKGTFIFELIRQAHLACVKAKIRDEITLIGSGGIVAAEHVPKAIMAGLDAIALDTSLFAALQVTFLGECIDQKKSSWQLPPGYTTEWGKQRIKNLINAWRDQLLEVLGAMGLREVRRLRGEMGRALLQKELEKEAFSGIQGYV